MLTITYSGRSKPSAEKIAQESGAIRIVRSSEGCVNWGRANARTRLNPDISNVTNKRKMRELFKEHDVPMPELYAAIRPSLYSDRMFFDNLEYPCIGRPDQHTRGRGLWKCYNAFDVKRAMQGTRRKRAATHFMEYIEADREYRCHIFQGKSIRISQKAFTDDTRTSYTTAKPFSDEEKKAVRNASKKAVAAVGLDFGTVDVLVKDGKAYVLEVNSAPGVGGSMPKLWADTFLKWKEENG